MPSNDNHNAHLTAKDRDRPSWPTRKLFNRGLIAGEVLDFGCGMGADVDFLEQKGLSVTGYDPHYAPDLPDKRFDTIICHYVLNVLFPKVQSKVLMDIAQLLKPGGNAYLTVRRDVLRPGFRTHKIHRKKTYQCNVILPYESLISTDFCEIYRYQHYNQYRNQENGDCPFCAPEEDRPLITESAQAYAITDKYPVSDGHTLILPKRHTPTFFDLTEKEQSACWMVLERARQLMKERYDPTGFNIGINEGASAGQTVDHPHIHLIPRHDGDIDNPTGGIRNVIPEKGDYTT